MQSSGGRRIYALIAAVLLGEPVSLIKTEFIVPDDAADYFFRNTGLESEQRYIICLTRIMHDNRSEAK